LSLAVTITTCLSAVDIKDDTVCVNYREVYVRHLGLVKKNCIRPTTFLRSHFSSLNFFKPPGRIGHFHKVLVISSTAYIM
jgi:hypothetical protein